MSTSVLYHAFQIEGVKYNSTSFEGPNIVFHADIADSHLCCPNCKSNNIYFKGQKEGLVQSQVTLLQPEGRKSVT